MKYFQGGYLGQKVKCKGLVTIDLFIFFPCTVRDQDKPSYYTQSIALCIIYLFQSSFGVHMQKLWSHVCCSICNGYCVSYCCDMGSKLLQKSVLDILGEKTTTTPTKPTNRCLSTTAESHLSSVNFKF